MAVTPELLQLVIDPTRLLVIFLNFERETLFREKQRINDRLCAELMKKTTQGFKHEFASDM